METPGDTTNIALNGVSISHGDGETGFMRPLQNYFGHLFHILRYFLGDDDDDDDGRINFNVAYSLKTARTRNS